MTENILEIDGRAYNVSVTEITESANVLYSDNTGRTIAAGARMTLDPLGTFYNHRIKVKRRGDDTDEYDKLFDYVTAPSSVGFRVKAVHNQTVIEYDAYISSAERSVHKIDPKAGKVFWNEMSLNIVAMEAQRLPD